MKNDTEETLTKIKRLEGAVKRLNAQGIRCRQCMHLADCAKSPEPTDKICICFETKVVQL